MVQFIPAKNTWSEAFQNIGSGLAQGYTNRADENAIQNAVSGLGENASAKDILNAVTGTKTYNPQSKQNFFKNFVGQQQFDELVRHNKANEERESLKSDLEKLKTEKEQKQQLNDALTLVDASDLEQDEKEALRLKINSGEASYDAIKHVLKPNKELIKKKEAEEDLKRGQTVFNELSALVPQVGKLKVPASYAGSDTAKAFAKFTSLNGGLESVLVDMVSRGTLSNTRFNYIKNELLPQPSDTQATIRGKLEGLAIMIGLDASALTGEKKETKSKENKAPEGKIKVRNKSTGKTGTVTPFEGMESKYERI